MNKLIYLINRRPVQPLTFGHQYDHNDLVIEFQGFTKLREDSTLYLKIDGNVKALVPLSDDNQMTVQNYITKEAAASIPCQLVEYKLKESTAVAYELISNSDIFFGTVLPSLDESEMPEITDPSLDLIYTQMHEMYLTIKNAYESGEFKGEKGDKGDEGNPGEPGYTPVKGTDYWTDTDKQEIIDDTVEAVQPIIDAEAERATTVETELQEDLNKKTDELYAGIDVLSAEILNRYPKSETYSQEEINNLISKIPKFAIEVVDTLPTSDISETTVYLLKTSETEADNLYTEYIYIGGKWEMLGTQKLDLSNYYKSAEVDKLVEAEKTERQNADAAVETKIADESTRATTAEATLQTSINEEATTRENADKALEAKISDTNSKKVGYQEVQGNTLYMYSDDTKAVLLATLELPAAPVQDVQINGSSIVTDGVATIPRGNDSNAGVVKPVYGYGLQTNNNYQLYGVSRSAEDYKTINDAHIISKGTLSNIQQSYVDEILCSTDEAKALTTEQQIAARERIGAAKSGEWELLRDYTFNESRTGGIQINTDEDGNQLELRKYFCQLITPASVTGNVHFYMDYIATDGVTKKNLNQTIGDALQASTKVYSAIWYDGLLYGRCGANQNAISQNSNENYILPDITPTGIRIYSSVNNTIPTGTRILLYGIRK